ncbi:hypothetical protein [Capnocytophaga leadbetteri]|uniref:hypothetical protein n=1 Tax=Capnocytophaga leadbetteri TaxID=327575 RepID=UPI0028EADB05|nr:hypothetical protein [Capnocytophaga leadbetteri]
MEKQKDLQNELLNTISELLDDSNINSVLILVRKTARFLIGNNLNTGENEHLNINEFIFENNLYHSFFSGIMGYFTLLDQLGCIFFEKQPIRNVLKKYSGIPKKEQEALVGLRNCLAHNYGLANKYHNFSLVDNNENERRVVELARTKKIQGDYSNKDDYYTSIYIHNFTSLVEDIFHKIKEDFSNNKLKPVIKNVSELRARFTIKQ